jgi:hypothetical protein
MLRMLRRWTASGPCGSILESGPGSILASAGGAESFGPMRGNRRGLPRARRRRGSGDQRLGKSCDLRRFSARPEGFEPSTLGFGGQYSIQLSYGRRVTVDRSGGGKGSIEGAAGARIVRLAGRAPALRNVAIRGKEAVPLHAIRGLIRSAPRACRAATSQRSPLPPRPATPKRETEAPENQDQRGPANGRRLPNRNLGAVFVRGCRAGPARPVLSGKTKRRWVCRRASAGISCRWFPRIRRR